MTAFFYQSVVRAIVPILLLAAAVPASAQMNHETMPIVLTADGLRVNIGPQWIPRCQAAADTLIVPAGTVTTLPASATYGCIEVQSGGRLRAERTRNTATRFTTMIVLPGGSLDVGTVADPIPCDRTVDLAVRDVSMDLTLTSKDPFQWGNGLVNFGQQTRVGCQKTYMVQATGSIAKGSTHVTLASDPGGWQVGDKLLIPDTAPASGKIYIERAESSRLEPDLTIVSILGRDVTFAPALTFDHLNILGLNGAVALRPRIANLTRNIVIRSENEAGTPGHTADIGRGASYDIRYNQMIGLGRTKAIPLNDTVAVAGVVTHVGTDVAGKYGCLHAHHLGSSPLSAFIGNSCIGGGGYMGDVMSGSKWGIVLHDTSDTLVEDPIAIFFKGAGIVTEDGYEVRNVFRHGLSAYNTMHLKPGDIVDANANVLRGCPGCEQTGWWFRGVMNTFDGIEAWNNGDQGVTLLNQDQPVNMYPSKPGGEPDTHLNHYFDKPVAFTDVVTAANARTGFEPWGIGKFPYKNLISAHNVISQVFAVNSVNIFLYLQNPQLICATVDGTATGYGTHSSMGYVSELTIDQGYIIDCATGIAGGGGIGVQGGPGTILNNVTLQNEVNVEQVPRGIDLTDVLFVPLRNYPHKHIQMTGVPVWSGTGPLPGPLGGNNFLPARGSRYFIRNHQRQPGKNYKLFHLHAKGSFPAWPSYAFPNQYNPPQAGLTVKQAWLLDGLSYGGDMIDDAEIVPLDGLIDGLARDGLGYAPGPPKAIPTFPTMREAAILEPEGCPANGQVCTAVKQWAVVTGDQTASSLLCASVDGGGIGSSPDPECIDRDQGDGPNDDRSFLTNHITPGTHTVTVWRTQKANQSVKLAGSEFTGCYYVGSPTPNAACGAQPPPVTVTVPNVVGQLEALAKAALVGAGLVATSTTATNPAPAGLVFAQAPAAGATVTRGSTVALSVSSGPVIAPPQTIPVPNVVGKLQPAASADLIAAGLIVGAVTSATNPAPAGQVVAQIPSAAAQVQNGSAVNLVLSSGPVVTPPQTTTVYTFTCDAAGNCKLVKQ